MKPVLLLFLSASLCAAQSNAVNGKGGGVTDAAAFRTALSLASATGINSASGPVVAVNSGLTTLTWSGVMAQMSVDAAGGRHALIARSTAGNAIAVVGLSSSGAAAGKFYQDTSYTSAALQIYRDSTAVTPAMSISASTGSQANPAFQVITPGTSTAAMTVAHNGNITTSGSLSASGGPNLVGGVSLSGGGVLASSVSTNTGNISAAGTISGSNIPATANIMIGNVAPSAAAPNGTIYINTAGTSTTMLYLRVAGAWVAK